MMRREARDFHVKMEQIVASVCLFLVLLTAVEATPRYKFEISRSAAFQYPGRSLTFFLTMTIPESTTLKAKVQMPFNTTAIMRLTEIRVSSVHANLQVGGSTSPVKKSTAGGDIEDLAVIDFGLVTRLSSSGDTNIKVKFKAQVLLRPHGSPGELQWVSVGTEYNNKSVWAAQLAVKISDQDSPRPVLDATLFENTYYQNPLFRDEFYFKVHVYHLPNTSAEVESGAVVLVKPAFLVYDRTGSYSGSIAITNVVSGNNSVRLEFGKLGFADKLLISIYLKLDPQKTIADGRVHHTTTSLDVQYNGPTDSVCAASTSRSRTYFLGKPVSSHVSIYVPRAECDGALGMEDGRIKDEQITASSYYHNCQPHKARLSTNGFWIPNRLYHTTSVNQYLQVNLTSQMKIRRIAIQGRASGYNHFFVKKLSVYYSNDGVLWTPYREGSKTKVFEGSYSSMNIHMSIFPIPIVSKFIRIRPLEWSTEINLRLELYGCESSEQSETRPLEFTSRSYMLNSRTDAMYVCSIPMDRGTRASTCFFSVDKGLTWTGIDYRLLFILGYDSQTKLLYGMANNLKNVMQSTQDHAEKFGMVEEKLWDQVRNKPSTVLPTPLELRDMVVTDGVSVESSPHNVTSDAGTLWTVSPFGVHVYEEPVWKLRMSWETNE